MSFRQRKKRPEVDPLGGNPQPHDKDFTSYRDEVIIGDIEAATQAEVQLRRRCGAACKIQSVARMWSQRARFVRHTAVLRGDISVLALAKQTRCAILLQRSLRGLIERQRYKRLLAAEEAKLAAEAAKKPKKGAKPAKGVKAEETTPAPPLSQGELALQRNMSFVAGFKAYLAGRWDEALHGFEAQLKLKPDAVTEFMLGAVREKKDGPGAAAAATQKGGASGGPKDNKVSQKKK